LITGLHVTIFTPQAENVRAFLRDKLGLPYTDSGGGWLIFEVPEGEIGAHPVEEGPDEPLELSFLCDDIEEVVSTWKERGVVFVEEVKDEGWGLVARFALPGGLEASVYQPT
jgi:catechol 2,3-dioxygenase-like lactoylglutathione lyase family enzyme